METMIATALSPLPNPDLALAKAHRLNQCCMLYKHLVFGDNLPVNFPMELVLEYPSLEAKLALKDEIANLSYDVEENLDLHYEYMKEYNTLYMHYVYGKALPDNFPPCILDDFPNPTYRQDLRNAVVSLQKLINKQKELF